VLLSGYIDNPDESALLQLAQAVIEVTGSRSEIFDEALPVERSAGPQVRRSDIGLARELLGREPEVDLLEGLSRTIDRARPAPTGRSGHRARGLDGTRVCRVEATRTRTDSNGYRREVMPTSNR
jgi:hypothetical protein